MKQIRYSLPALKAPRRHANMAAPIQAAIEGYAAGAQRNNVQALAGSDALRLRVGDVRVIFEETEGEIIVTTIGPRGSVYEA